MVEVGERVHGAVQNKKPPLVALAREILLLCPAYAHFSLHNQESIRGVLCFTWRPKVLPQDPCRLQLGGIYKLSGTLKISNFF